MEYDKWDPKAGLAIDSEMIGMIKKDGIDAAGKTYESAHAGNGKKPAFFEGEMLNLGLAHVEKGDDETAVKIFELNAKAYPNSHTSHQKCGSHAPEAQRAIVKTPLNQTLQTKAFGSLPIKKEKSGTAWPVLRLCPERMANSWRQSRSRA